jgi:LacI family transcriptional regulator
MKHPPKVIVLLEATRGFDRGLLRGISRYISFHGPWILYREPPDYLRGVRSRSLLAEMKAWRPQGIICPAVRLREARELGIPCIVFGINEDIPDLPSITSDNAGAGEMAARHLVGTGLRSFAFCGLDDMRWSRQRCEAFCRELTGRGMAPHVFQQPRVGRRSDREPPFLKKWLRSLPRPSGLLCANDDRAAVVAETCRVLGLRVPDDLAVMGVDNDEFVWAIRP